MMNQLKQFFSQYIQNSGQLREQLEEQYRPKLQQKIEQLSSQIGAEVALDINGDPEFLALVKKNQAGLDEQYQEALDQFKEQIQTLFKQIR
jgi:hypothetical protein